MAVEKALVQDHAAVWVTLVLTRDCAVESVEVGGELCRPQRYRAAVRRRALVQRELILYLHTIRSGPFDQYEEDGNTRTLCMSPATSCLSTSFRAADCCSTRMAPSRERGRMGDVGAVSYRSSSSTSRRASWASSSVTRRSASERAARSRSHSSRSVERSAAEYARAAAVHVVCGCSCRGRGLGGTVDHRE
jgi:hypothetical protein